MTEKLIGRQKEIAQLQKCMDANQAQLIIVYGRRRVGKTFLINNFFNGRFDFKVAGSYAQTKEVQLKNFITELNLQSKQKLKAPENWTDAFFCLREYLDTLPKTEKHVIFFDEMPWFDTPRSDFLPAFEYFWNNWGSAQDNLVCLVCGSATAWLVDNIARNKGGLYNRQSCKLYLEPFTLNETEQYLKVNGFEWSRYQIVENYMIMGGIPYYLSLLDNSISLEANIDNMFFKKRALLWDEFEHLYATLFNNSEQYLKVVEALTSKKIGLTRKEISQITKLPPNGSLTKILENLVNSEFVRAYQFFGNKKQDTLYQLSDYFTLFYYKFLKNNSGKDERFWSNSIDNPSVRAWEGFTFEQVCKDHIQQIKKKLGISGILTEVSSWFTKSTEEADGAQIDMLIDRRDKVINICEMKFAVNEYELDKDYEKKLINKIECFRKETGSKKALHLTMVTTYGIKQNSHSGRIQSEVTMDDLFQTT